MPYRVNGQYIMEGLASSFLFCLGGGGFIILHHTMEAKSMPKLNHILLLSVGFGCIILSSICCFIFIRMKLPLVFSYYFINKRVLCTIILFKIIRVCLLFRCL